ncbi:isoquinoline 1-oxidoreductase maturation factor [Shewanella sp. Choline-02u-19]|uniref:XdhC family protein n=1 Tax=unclassified Shewanella TaxID=196818 RepID=UPI000C3381B0|nr:MULTISPECIES: XdhC/CoxI family protein [unclassified Shewanella]PKH59282.1 isoquinoline 1-oxidoreductase maturation factor [Shewanella sp. Bg11-22]PKI27157.1 isoquinoline 1-oxidoreductase maturation factor [Shewanella sp. Choline-02u-19]
MSNHIEDLLSEWQLTPHDGWVLAVVTKVQGSAYRKAGAMMLFHPLGKSIGLVSGGCLEGDLKRHAQRAIQYNTAVKLVYDATDESDTTYQLGCGGIIELMLFPLTSKNHYLQLHRLAENLQAGIPCLYELVLPDEGTTSDLFVATVVNPSESHYPPSDVQKPVIFTLEQTGHHPMQQEHRLVIPCRPRFHIAIFGGGLDAQPLANIANQLGWQVTVIDERTSYARHHDFPSSTIIKQTPAKLTHDIMNRFDAAVVMQHNLTLDANAILRLSQTQICYVALLGPPHRREKVLAIAGVSANDFSGVFSAPAGLALGGELPESIALSILAQCHGVLHKAHQVSLDKVMT